MARKQRLEYAGACYHVINRGNYRQWVFDEEGAREAFERVLFAACVRSGWELHAFVVMGNHFHLAVGTPLGNLVSGMQWLQSTFATRFNRYRKEHGHLFQGRYKAIVVEGGEPLGRVCHYIHLNPVRAGIVPVENLSGYRHSSYWHLGHREQRREFMRVQTALAAAGNLADDDAGLASYAAYLAWQDAHGPAGRSPAYENLSRGWALGSDAFRQGLLEDHRELEPARAWESLGVRGARQQSWRLALDQLMQRAGNPAGTKTKSAPLKVALAAVMKQQTDASNGWLAESLGMGSAAYVGKLVSDLNRKPKGEAWKLVQRLQN